MKIRGPLFFRLGLILAGLYVVFGTLAQCSRLRMTKTEVEKEFNKISVQPVFGNFKTGSQTLHYAKIGNDTLPMVVFVHGSPGSWNAYINYFKDTALSHHACLISVDRPGYGESNLGSPMPSLQEQAALIAPILKTSKNARKPILVGHSMGGPIIARMAMDYPGMVGGLIFIAPSIDPGMEKKEYYRHLLKTGIIQAILPPDLNVSNRELMPLKNELEKMLPYWQNIKVPCTIIHGTKDMLVPYGNVAFFEKHLINAPKKEVITLENVNHFIPWTHYNTVKGKILEYLKY